MAYNTSNEREYYQDSSKYGSYQFVSLNDIITYFMTVYVGEEKIINKASRTDVAFFAQRALAEMSFDTFKSIKSQQITLPNTQIMPLPHDYVNYTKISSVDSSGVKHPLYPTKHTSNPFQIRQTEDGSYDFPSNADLVTNSDFATGTLESWTDSFEYKVHGSAGSAGTILALSTAGEKYMYTQIVNNALEHVLTPSWVQGQEAGSARATWQKIDTTNIDYVDVEAQAVTTAALAGTTNSSAATTANDSAGNIMSSTNNFVVSTGNYYAADSGNSGSLWSSLSAIIGNEGTSNALDIPLTTVRVGISTKPGQVEALLWDGPGDLYPSQNASPDIFDIAYVEWTAGEEGFKNLYNVDVRQYDEIFIVVTSTAEWTNTPWGEDQTSAFVKTRVDDITVKNSYAANQLQERSTLAGKSSTWEKYKDQAPSELRNDDYEDDVLWPNHGERYGIEPSHAQINGSFYIDELRGSIHFSSNISGKDVILDYISDSLGTEEEMKVPKLAEDAMYKHILCDLMASRRNVGVGQQMYYKRQKFAAVRKAKLRLSNLKIEELTQILRGKSKHIKH
jgi:hypothetical protein